MEFPFGAKALFSEAENLLVSGSVPWKLTNGYWSKIDRIFVLRQVIPSDSRGLLTCESWVVKMSISCRIFAFRMGDSNWGLCWHVITKLSLFRVVSYEQKFIES